MDLDLAMFSGNYNVCVVHGEHLVYVSLFLDCFQCRTKHREYWNKLIVDKCWIDVINK
jgi:hypothetical protein